MKKILLLILSGVFFGCSAQTTHEPPFLEDAINLSIQYLKNNTLPSGRFVYIRHNIAETTYDTVDYNALRHAGTLYAMYQCERYRQDTTLRAIRLRASHYFIKNFIEKIDNERFAVVSKGEEEGKRNNRVAKLGGAGLALIALSNLYIEKQIDLDILTGLGNFILFMQEPNGNFRSKFLLKTNQIDTAFYSLYYPGEAALGLLYLNDVNPQEKWIVSAKKALLYLADRRKDQGTNVEFDHWALLATQKLFDTPDNLLTQAEKQVIQKHAEQIANSIINTQILDKSHRFYGSFLNNIRPGSIGTIMEGLVAAYCVTNDKELQEKIKNTLIAGVTFLSNTQIKQGYAQGGLPARADWEYTKSLKDGMVRIDNVQHVLSAWITFKKFVSE